VVGFLETIGSKFYGEAEQRMADVFDACEVLGKESEVR